jgi:hypothetical protein
MEELQQTLDEALSECAQRGMIAPFIVCALSPNGSTICVRMNLGGDPDVLAEHFEGDGFRMPITIAVVDQSGRAVRIAIERDGRRAVH